MTWGCLFVTQKQLIKFLSKFEKAPFSRKQFEAFCEKQRLSDPSQELTALCSSKFACWVSYTNFESGFPVYSPDDLFKLTDKGHDTLDADRKDKRRWWAPMILSIIAIVISIIALFKP